LVFGFIATIDLCMEAGAYSNAIFFLFIN